MAGGNYEYLVEFFIIKQARFFYKLLICTILRTSLNELIKNQKGNQMGPGVFISQKSKVSWKTQGCT